MLWNRIDIKSLSGLSVNEQVPKYSKTVVQVPYNQHLGGIMSLGSDRKETKIDLEMVSEHDGK
jgi:hypothetical protein